MSGLPLSQDAVVPVRGRGTQRPLFLVQGGGDLHFPVLAAQLEPDIPLHALPAIAPGDTQPRTLEERARGLLDVLRAVQPRGPYRLAGGSFGGVLAYELAIQLIGLDERVEFLALIDTALPRRLELLRHLEQASLGTALDHESAQAYALAHYRVFPIPLPVHLFVASEPAHSGYLGWDAVLPAARLHAVAVPGKPGRLMQAPYVQALGSALDDALRALAVPAVVSARSAGHQALLTIQGGRAGQTPVFCVPGAGDGVTRFIGLADALGPTWPMHGLQPRGLDGQQVPFGSVETAAAAYLDAIDAMHDGAALHLIGHSFGGWIAFEMASRLRARGRPVASLTLIDSEAPEAGGVLGRPYTATAVLERLIAAMEAATGRMLDIDLAVLRAQDEATQMSLLHAGMVGAGLLPPRAAPEIMAGPLRAFGSALRTRYQPQHGYDGPVRLVRAEALAPGRDVQQPGQHEMSEGWRRYAPDLEVWQGPGHHFSILKPPHVQRLARWWDNSLQVAHGPV